MPLGPYMIHCAVRIIGDQEWDDRTRRHPRGPIGTGFCIRIESEAHPGEWYGYLVTANHVVEGQSNVELEVADPHQPGQLYPRVTVSDWRQPIDELDVAVVPFAPPSGYTVTALQVGFNLIEHLPVEALLAAPFHYVGLLEPLNLMMARSGTLGLVDQEMDHGSGYRYRTHLADARSYQGFSGSPCFVEYAVPTLKAEELPIPLPAGSPPAGRLRYLHLMCGMVTSHLERTGQVAEASALGVLYILSSDEIWRALMSDELVEKRRKLDQRSREPSARPVNLSVGSGNDEFEHFEDLTRRLVRVPKKELDERLAEGDQ